MKKLLISLLFFPLIQTFAISSNLNDVQSIEVVNNSDQSLNVNASSIAQSLKLSYSVPSRAHSLIVSQLTQLKSPQEMLFEAILNDSVSDIQKAIQLGANVNQGFNGKCPLIWAIAFEKFNSIKCLLENGASI